MKMHEQQMDKLIPDIEEQAKKIVGHVLDKSGETLSGGG